MEWNDPGNFDFARQFWCRCTDRLRLIQEVSPFTQLEYGQAYPYTGWPFGNVNITSQSVETVDFEHNPGWPNENTVYGPQFRFIPGGAFVRPFEKFWSNGYEWTATTIFDDAIEKMGVPNGTPADTILTALRAQMFSDGFPGGQYICPNLPGKYWKPDFISYLGVNSTLQWKDEQPDETRFIQIGQFFWVCFGRSQPTYPYPSGLRPDNWQMTFLEPSFTPDTVSSRTVRCKQKCCCCPCCDG